MTTTEIKNRAIAAIAAAKGKRGWDEADELSQELDYLWAEADDMGLNTLAYRLGNAYREFTG